MIKCGNDTRENGYGANKYGLKPLSLMPLKPEEALDAFMKVDQERIRRGMR